VENDGGPVTTISTSLIRVETNGKMAVITLDRPDKANTRDRKEFMPGGIACSL
jgi:hypothetical protein